MFFGNDENSVNLAVDALSKGKLVAIPTETVYGLAANALSKEAVSRIYKAKGRPSDNPLIIHISDISEVEKYAEFTEEAKMLAEKFWPGPLTMILKKKEIIPSIVTAGLDSVAVRMPDNSITRNIIKKAGFPLAAPSANLSGKPSPTTAEHVYNDYNGRMIDNEEAVLGIIDGGVCAKGLESTIITLTDKEPVLVRPGVITYEELKKLLPNLKIAPAVFSEMKKGEKPISPGMAHKHYSPITPTVGITGKTENISEYINIQAKYNKVAVICFDEDYDLFNSDVIKISYGKKEFPESLAKNLFSSLREADEKKCDIIYAEIISDFGIYLAVYNRLIRACGFKVIDTDIPAISVSITGPSGAGKSTLCSELEKCGFFHIDGDSIAAEILPMKKSELVKVFGNSIINPDNSVNKSKLAKIAFSSKSNTEKLNKIMHPAITKRIIEISNSKKLRKIPVLIDGAAIFEAKINELTDITISVTAPYTVRKNRIFLRDNISEEMIDNRFSRQLSDEFFIKNADFSVVNDKNMNITQLKDEIIAFIKSRKG